jgi:protein-glutamine gamma-glutamyltransferase
MLALCMWLAVIAWQVGRSFRPARPDPLARAYARLCRKLARIVRRAPHEGPLAFGAALVAKRPELRTSVLPLLERYAELRYGPPPQPERRAREIRMFREAVTRLTLPRTAD